MRNIRAEYRLVFLSNSAQTKIIGACTIEGEKCGSVFSKNRFDQGCRFLGQVVGIGRLEFSSAASDDAEVIFWNTPQAEKIRDMVRSLQSGPAA